LKTKAILVPGLSSTHSILSKVGEVQDRGDEKRDRSLNDEQDRVDCFGRQLPQSRLLKKRFRESPLLPFLFAPASSANRG
jgi:hypothetical protein